MAKRISYSRITTATNIALTEIVDGATVLSVSHSAVTNTATYDAYRREREHYGDPIVFLVVSTKVLLAHESEKHDC